MTVKRGSGSRKQQSDRIERLKDDRRADGAGEEKSAKQCADDAGADIDEVSSPRGLARRDAGQATKRDAD